MIRGTLYVSHIPLLPSRLTDGPTSALTISNPGLRHHLIIISGQWDTLIALSAPLIGDTGDNSPIFRGEGCEGKIWCSPFPGNPD